MEISHFDYFLPQEAIAQLPAPNRDQSKLMRIERATGRITHHHFCELPDLLPPGVRIFRNNATVLKARIQAQRPLGGRVECLLLRPCADRPEQDWWCLLKPGKKLPIGSVFGLPGIFQARVEEKHLTGETRVRFQLEGPSGNVLDLAQLYGQIPLPPYIQRSRAGQDLAEFDSQRYNTVYAHPNQIVAAAAPTAGLHFTQALFDRLEALGISVYDLTLHIGLGTFQPIQVEDIAQHIIHREFYQIPAATLQAAYQGNLGPRLAVGTTTLRALEDAFSHSPFPPLGKPFEADARLFIYPPAHFKAVDLLLTNFHLPRSTLLCLVAAFLAPGKTEGVAWIKALYQEALARGYRFYSYGDAMLIV